MVAIQVWRRYAQQFRITEVLLLQMDTITGKMSRTRHFTRKGKNQSQLNRQIAAGAFVDGAPDEYVIESWVGAPAHCLPETADWTFTGSVRDFCRRFVKPEPGKLNSSTR